MAMRLVTNLDKKPAVKPGFWHSWKPYSLMMTAALLVWPLAGSAQTASGGDRWLHVRVVSADGKGESVCVNVPLELAEKVLPAINKKELHGGKVTIDKFDDNGVDFRAVLEAVRSSKDGEFVTVNGKDGEDVRVAKQAGFLVVHVTDTTGHLAHHHHVNKDDDDKKQDENAGKTAAKSSVSHVEVKIPLSVVDALLSAGKDEIDLVAGLRALSSQGDTELVSVKDEENTVRVWVDSKNGNGTEGGSR
jgi:hypothetical protein